MFPGTAGELKDEETCKVTKAGGGSEQNEHKEHRTRNKTGVGHRKSDR